MKPTYQIHPLSGPGNYTPLSVSGVSPSTANTLHTASATDIDELWVECYNYSTSDVILSVTIGGTAPHQTITQLIPPGRGLIPLIRGLKVGGGVIVKVYAGQAGAISVLGYVHRIVFI